MTYTIEANEEEIKALQEMLHRACLHSGMQVADAAAHWNRKLIEAVRPRFPPLKTNGAALKEASKPNA